MNRAAAWSVRGVGRETREAAQEAARRAGMSLGEWLDEVIADQAADQGVDPDDLDEDERLDAIGDRLSGISRRDDSRMVRARYDRGEARERFRPRRRSGDEGDPRRSEELLDAAISRFESRAAKSDARTARALDSVASLIEGSQSGRRDEREALRAVVGRLESLEERLVRQQAERSAGVSQSDSRGGGGARDGETRTSEFSRRVRSPDKNRVTPRERPRIDIDEAVSEIVRRRQELDAQTADGSPSPNARGWRNFGVDAPAQRAADAPAGRDDRAQESAANALRLEVRKLNQRLEELRRENSEKRETPVANIESLRGELAAMSRSLADLAPRNAVVALEGAIRDLSQRVAASRENGARETLLAPVEGLVAGLCESLRAHDPREAVEALRREIGAINAKVDGIGAAAIDPLVLEPIRRQVEETRNLLSALAQRPMPLDRLERQIGELADRVEHLSTSPAPQAESAQVVASLAEARAQVERSTSTAALNSIERRLEQIASRIDQALERPGAAPAFNPRAFEDLSRRIDGVRESIESRYPSAPGAPADIGGLERTMRELSAKLDKPVTAAVDPNAFEGLFQDLGARLDRRPYPAADAGPLEQLQRNPAERPPTIDTRPLEGLMRELSSKLDRSAPPAVDAAVFESMIQDLGERIDRLSGPVVDTRPLEQTLRSLHDKIDRNVAPQIALERIDRAVEDLSVQIAKKTATFDSHALEGMVADLLAQLDETRRALRDASAAPARASGNDEAYVRGLSDLRAEQSNSDRRVQSALGGVHDMLETLVERIGQIEEDVTRVGRAPRGSEGAPPAPANQGARSSAVASAALDSIDATIRGAPVFAPARAPSEPRADENPEPRAPLFASATPMRSIDGSEFLIEPGSGAPLRASAGDAIVGANSKSAINAHIAAARRAAQAALAETANNIAKGAAKPSADKTAGVGGVEQAKAFLAARRRPILLGVALVALLTIAFVELGVLRQPSILKSEGQTIAAPKFAAAELAKGADVGKAPAKADARALDTTPVGSIGAAPAEGPVTKFLSPAPAELVASIPAAAPQVLRDAAAAGDPAAQFELASRLIDGRALPRDPHAAFLWFDRAAAQGLAPAQYRLASLYEKGLGVARDAQLATAWYKKAANAGNARAMHNLAVLIAGSGSIKPDYAEAADWFRKAAQLGVKDSQFNLAILYARGMGVAQDLSQSWLWFSLAAQQGDADAARKRDEVAAKMDASALAADVAALANFRVTAPNPAANDVPAPPAGWDVGKIGAPQATAAPPRVSQPAAAPI